MDGTRFDSWTKQFATRRSRRSLLRGMAGGVFAVVGMSQAAEARCSRDAPIRCGDGCVDLRTDPDNCGRCGNGCATGLCYAGRCLESCPSGFEPCGGTCIRACTNGQVCREGACQDPIIPPAGICTLDDDACAEVGTFVCDDRGDCYCAITTSGHPLCASGLDGVCADCTSDAECPDGFFCHHCEGCEDVIGVTMPTACAPPCPLPL